MRLHVVQTKGFPPDSVVSVKSGSSRRQQTLPCQAAFKLEQPPAPVQLDVLSYAAKGQEVRLSDPDQELVKVPLRDRDGKTVSVTFRVVKAGESIATESCSEPKATRKEKEVLIESYLQKHGLHDFMKEVFQGLTEDKPEDPFVYIGRCLHEAAAKREAASSRWEKVSHQSGSCRERLRQKARETLSKSYLDGSLTDVLGRLQVEPEAQPGDLLPPNVEPEAPHSPAAAESSARPLTEVQRLRRKARETLSNAHLDGRLSEVLQHVPVELEATSGDLLLPTVGPETPPAAAESAKPLTEVQRLRRKARETLSKAFFDGRLVEALQFIPAEPEDTQGDSLPSVEPAVPPSAAESALSPVPQIDAHRIHLQRLSEVPQNAPVESATDMDPVLLCPAVFPDTPSVAPFAALPQPSAWVLTDGDDSPRLSRFAPTALQRKSSLGEGSQVSGDLLEFVPDRSAWLLQQAEKERTQEKAEVTRWSRRTLTSEKLALQAVLAEFTPRMSQFIPAKGALPPPTRSTERSEADVSAFMPQQVIDPDLQLFRPLQGGLLGQMGPRELPWHDTHGAFADQRLMQFIPSFPTACMRS
mmetsp:Transcript_61740/g.144843  ORF Transcript_61740/g.144843 Transcript_61740/m.144843 type:complete len:585 (+) Transcript_61740:48-1802(+)